MTAASRSDLKAVLAGLEGALTPLDYEPSKNRRSWVRTFEGVQHVVELTSRYSNYGLQWGVVCPELTDMVWDIPYEPFKVACAVVSGTPSHIQHPIKASFNAQEAARSLSEVVDAMSSAASICATTMEPLRTRKKLRRYLLEDREASDSRFLVPSKLPLKLFVSAGLAALDRDPAACRLIEQATQAMKPRFAGEITTKRLAKLNAAAKGLCA